MNVGIVGEGNETTIVLITGLGYTSPVISYKPFAESLADKYRVIIVEPFGYGISDVTKDERNTKNIVSELHACIQKLGLEKYYLMAHSIGGIYSLAYTNEYPEEILGYIGLDPTPRDGLLEMPFLDSIKMRLELGFGNLVNKLGLVGLLSSDIKFIQTQAQLDPNYQYSEEDKETMEIIFNYRFCNDNTVNENINTYNNKNIDAVADLSFPDSIPVIQFVSSMNCENNKDWLRFHQKMQNANPDSEVLVLEGSHLIYIDQRQAISDKIKNWI
ncbi:alpha/beta-hydrolase, partial [Piromyces finnis]